MKAKYNTTSIISFGFSMKDKYGHSAVCYLDAECLIDDLINHLPFMNIFENVIDMRNIVIVGPDKEIDKITSVFQ
jgi:hypothetical protein